jgi:hypothetical protein
MDRQKLASDRLQELARGVRLSTAGSPERTAAVKELAKLAKGKKTEVTKRTPAEQLAFFAKGGD